MRLPFRTAIRFGVILPALAVPALAAAQNYSDLPPLTPMSESEMRSLPVEYRSAPVMAQVDETITNAGGVETVTRTRRIDATRPLPAAPAAHYGYAQQGYAPQGYAPQAYSPHPYGAAPVVFEREQWIDECRRRTAGRNDNDTGLIIGGLLGAIAGGFAGYEIAGAGDRVLGTALGAGGGGLIGGLLGSLIGGGKKKNRYDCEAALDGYLTQYGAPGTRIASREIPYAPYPGGPAYGYPAQGYPAYAQNCNCGYVQHQTVLVPVRTEIQQQVIMRETVREETYTVPGAVRTIPARPSPKMIKTDR